MAGDGLELAVKATTAFTHPGRAERTLAGKIGLPRRDAWTRHFANLRGVKSVDRYRIADGGGFEKASQWKRIGRNSNAIIEPIEDDRRAMLAVAALRRRVGQNPGTGTIDDLISSAGNPARFAAAARDARCADDAAILVVDRSVEVEAAEDGDDARLCVDYDLEVIVAASAGARAVIADAAVHAALGRQFDADMTALGRSLAAAGYHVEVFCSVVCRSDGMRSASNRIADLLRHRQDVFRDHPEVDLAGFPDFRVPSVLDF